MESGSPWPLHEENFHGTFRVWFHFKILVTCPHPKKRYVANMLKMRLLWI